jgi:hypothetical protein
MGGRGWGGDIVSGRLRQLRAVGSGRVNGRGDWGGDIVSGRLRQLRAVGSGGVNGRGGGRFDVEEWSRRRRAST